VKDLAGKALVTGASRGIGAAIARALHRDGWQLVIHYSRSEAEALSLAAELGAAAVRCDVADSLQVREMFGRIGDVDLLVNNAGIAHYGLMSDMNEETWRRLFAVNVDGAYHCCRAAVPHMVRQKKGCIINISSVWGVRGASCEAAYSAAKAAIIGLTRALAKELGPSGVRVNAIAPGVIKTDMISGLGPEALAALADETPLCRLGTPEDVAELAAFLASDRASFITGQVIAADGGFAV
jgi:3-oxoacyl-[acyl-carrier protein] reductase